MTSTLDALSGAGTSGTAIIDQTLQQYGLQSLTTWALGELNAGASTDQVTLDMYNQPAFQQRFPGIFQLQAAGQDAISPADYISYEQSMAQLEHQYGLAPGTINNTDTIGNLIGGQVSASEVTDRVQQGYNAVATAPAEVRSMFASYYGVSGDGALASYFLNPSKSLPVLEQQAQSALLGGVAGMGGVNVNQNQASRLAQLGVTQSQVQSGTQNVEQEQSLFNAQANEKPGLTGEQGLEASLGTSAADTQAVQQRESERQEEFAGGGNAYMDQYGAEGTGAAQKF